MQKYKAITMVAAVALVVAGCVGDENTRLAEMAERNLERQAAQQARNTELQKQVAEGTRQLIESDAAARKEIVSLHRDVQAERSELGRQRDSLESERREIAAARNRDPIIAQAIKAVGLIAVCLVPLLIALQVLRRSNAPDESAAMAEILLNDLTSGTPRLIQARDQRSTDAQRGTPRLTHPKTKRIDRS